jgi:hypothetical protein
MPFSPLSARPSGALQNKTPPAAQSVGPVGEGFLGVRPGAFEQDFAADVPEAGRALHVHIPAAALFRRELMSYEIDADRRRLLGAAAMEPDAYTKKFTGKYTHRTIGGGVGHNLPQEAPHAFAQAIRDVERL